MIGMIGPPVLASASSVARPTMMSVLPGAGIGEELARLVLSLAAVIALILLIAWLSRRLQQLHARRSGRGRRLECVESLNTGLKERLLLIRIDQTEILLGSSPRGLQTLHVMAASGEPAAPVPPVPPTSSFDTVLQRWLPPR